MPIIHEHASSPDAPHEAGGSTNGFGRQDSMANESQSQNQDESKLSTRQLNVLKRKRKREAQKAAQGKSGFGDLTLRRTTTAGSDGFADDTPMPDADSKKNGKMSDYFNLDRPTDVDEDSKVVSEFKGPILLRISQGRFV
jgi:TATA-binding protein-associated factor